MGSISNTDVAYFQNQPIYEDEAKQIRCLNAQTLKCCAYNQRTVLIVCSKYWQVSLLNYDENLEWIFMHCTIQNIDGLVQDWGISIANAMEIPQSCTKPLISHALAMCIRQLLDMIFTMGFEYSSYNSFECLYCGSVCRFRFAFVDRFCYLLLVCLGILEIFLMIAQKCWDNQGFWQKAQYINVQLGSIITRVLGTALLTHEGF